MNVKSAKKIGFFAALSISLGSVVGIGIFLKNLSVIKEQGLGPDTFSFWSLIVCWIIAAVISLCAAYSFTQISTCKVGKSGLSGWIEVLGGKKQGVLIRTAHSTMYFSIFASVIPFLAVEGLFKAINTAVNGTDAANMHFGFVFLGGLVVLIFVSFFNYLSIKNSAKFQSIGTFIKIIPLVAVGVIGLIGANGSHIIDKDPSTIPGIGDAHKVPVTTGFNVNGMFVALPAVLFSFDAFLTIGNLGNDVKNPQKTIPLVAVLSIVIAAVVYILISIGAGLTGYGDAASIVKTIFANADPAALAAVDITINILITLSAIFVANGLSMGSLKLCESMVENREIMFFSFFEKLNQKRQDLGGFVLYWIQILFYLIILLIPAIAMNNDAILDSATNAPVLIFFFVYAYTMLLGIIDRYTKKQCKQVKGYMVAAPIAILVITVVFVYVFFYQNIYKVSTLDYMTQSSSGLFFSNKNWYQAHDAILFWSILLFAIGFAFLNYYVVKKQKEKLNIKDNQIATTNVTISN